MTFDPHRQRVKKLQKELADAAQRIAQLERENTALIDKADDASDRLKDANRRLERMQNRVDPEAEGRVGKLQTQVDRLKKQKEKLIEEANTHIERALNKASDLERKYKSLARQVSPDYYAIADRLVSLSKQLSKPLPICLQLDLEEIALNLDLELNGRSLR